MGFGDGESGGSGDQKERWMENHREELRNKGVSPGIHGIPSNNFFNLTREISLFLFCSNKSRPNRIEVNIAADLQKVS